MKTSYFSDSQAIAILEQAEVAVRHRNSAGNMTSVPPRFTNGIANMAPWSLPDDPVCPQSVQLGLGDMLSVSAQCEGLQWNHERAYGIYHELALNL